MMRAGRRKFLRGAAGSLALAGFRPGAWAADAPVAAEITSPLQAVNVFDLEAAARRALPPAHFGFLATGVEGDATIRANRDGFGKFQIRARRLVDTTQVDTRVEVFGAPLPAPIVLCPASSQRAFHAEGEVATARAARSRQALQILSTMATTSVEDVIGARGAPVWFQLYPTTDWNITRALLRRAEAAGCPVVALTVDNVTPAGRDSLVRAARADRRDCAGCHAPGPAYFRRKPMFDGLDVSALRGSLTAHMTWDFVRRVQDSTSMKLVLKGIVTAEDAALAREHGVAGLIVSNHGGRSEESARSTIECLPEVVEAVGGRMPVLIDSGFRRGSDIFKALALGAAAVCVGRPYLWGLAAFGQAGVERSLDILRSELETTMRASGAPSVAAIGRSFVQRA